MHKKARGMGLEIVEEGITGWVITNDNHWYVAFKLWVKNAQIGKTYEQFWVSGMVDGETYFVLTVNLDHIR